MTIDYNCDPCTDKACETLMLTDDKLYKRFLIRILCAIKGLLGGGGPVGYATEATLLTVDGKITACDTTDVTITSMPPVSVPAGLATEVTLSSIDGKITACDTTDVTITSMPPVSVPPGLATEATLSSIDGKITACNTGAVAGSVGVTNAGGGSAVNIQDGGNTITVDGTVNASCSGSVSVSNAGGGSAVNIQDGGNTITVDGSVSVSNAGGGSAVNIQDGGNTITVDGSVTASCTGTVTANAGTNLNTSALALEGGGNLAAAATSLAVMDDWDDTDRCKVNTIAGQVGVQGGSGTVTALTQRVVLATDVALPAGSNAIGKLAANSGIDIGDVDVLSMPSVAQATAANLNAQVVGNVAHDGADSGNPVKIGAIARTANPTAATATRRTDIFADDVGRLVVVQGQCRDLVGIQTTNIASSSAETTIITQAAGVFNDITSLSLTNRTATACYATLKDSTGGTTRAIYDLAANGGIVLTFNPPMPQAAVNTNWTITLSVNTVTVDVNAVFVKNV